MYPRNRINSFHKWAILTISVLVDGIQWVLVVLPPFQISISIFAAIIFFTWFMVLDVKVIPKRKPLPHFLSRVIVPLFEAFGSWVPIFNFIPAWTIGNWFIIKNTQAEDREYNKQQEEMMGAV